MIIIPPLKDEIKLNQNLIHHLKEKGYKVIPENLIQQRSYITFNANGKNFCITGNKNIYPTDVEYILLSEHTPKISEVESIKIKKWIKHPKNITYNTSDINKSWYNNFNFKAEVITPKYSPGLRIPQIGAIHSILGHLTNPKNSGIVVLPTGTGKTETMLSVLVAKQCEKLLVIVPSDALRLQISDKFIKLGLLKEFGIITNECLFPKVGILKKGIHNINDLKDFFSKSNVVITTMNLISSLNDSDLKNILALCSHMFIDEAHHSKATQWNRVISKFDKSNIIQFTATPFRNDGLKLEGKFIYNFSMKEAQEQGYFTKIDFIPIREYDLNKADELIAETAINRLIKDRDEGKDHFLMARCKTRVRAEEIFRLYQKYSQFNPVVIHSKTVNKSSLLEEIKKGKHKIIVCVDMLGEGFDLPQLKIAALHDIRQSLPITLQFIGRFTRISNTYNLGDASFVTNLYQTGIEDDIDLLYDKDSNWNTVLPDLSRIATQNQIDFNEFLSGFDTIEESNIPFQNINPAFSTLVYKNSSKNFNKLNKITNHDFDGYQHCFLSFNEVERTLIILLGKEKSVEWGRFNDFKNFDWNLMVIFHDATNNLLFIHSSEKRDGLNFLVDKIFPDGHSRIKELDVFKIFHNVKRLLLFNVGMRIAKGKDKSFQSYFGSNIQAALTKAELNTSIKNNIFGIGYEEGERVSFGASRKGKIWSYLRGNIKELKEWCLAAGVKLIDEKINPNDVLDTLEPKIIPTRPDSTPYFIDWNPLIYKEIDTTFTISTRNNNYNLFDCELRIIEPKEDGNIKFELLTPKEKAQFELIITQTGFEIKNILNPDIYLTKGSSGKNIPIINEFNSDYTPQIGFIENSMLIGNRYIKFNEEILQYPKDEINVLDWTGTDLSKESMGFSTPILNSIQYKLFKEIETQNWDIIFNDDDSGEMADIVTIREEHNKILLQLYHIKFIKKDGTQPAVPTNDMEKLNIYQICGQVQKSINWKYKDYKFFKDHFTRRESKKANLGQSRILVGDIDILNKLCRSMKTKPLQLDVFLVHPGINKRNASSNILKLLYVTANHLEITANIKLKVIGSDV